MYIMFTCLKYTIEGISSSTFPMQSVQEMITMYGQQNRLTFVNTSTIATHCHRIVNTASYVVKT